ncbi:RDD family protein [Streptomyces sp. MST-110588]|uniref:RDD family protein n=1 Tax=Streptomyces sp. MST-110588 TaxID=2833628 RepID=UPI001F5E2583|nr:RDD family protein [Streptomyces sp. MST-110588]UNO42098.1 RDD family protein [Streptomyces sp. MST-110588]
MPGPAGLLRRFGAITVDSFLLALCLGVSVIGTRVGVHMDFPKAWLVMAGCGFGVSFVNHVLLTRVLGASVGKYLCRTRVILEKTGTRPHLPRLFKRWLGGYLFLILWIIASVFDMEDEPEDMCGVRMVRLRDLRSAPPAAV